MTHTRTQLAALLEAHDLGPSRALGQNFVVDPNTVRRIARLADVGPDQPVVEIGAGLGSLTLALAETGASVTAVEIGEGFGACTVTGSCEAVCPKNVSLNFIARLNRDYAIALLKGEPKKSAAGGA